MTALTTVRTQLGRWFYITGAVVILFGTIGMGLAEAQVSVQVTNKITGSPIAKALCLAQNNKEAGSKAFVLANTRGVCALPTLPAGNYTLRVDAVGFEPDESQVMIGASPVNVERALKPMKTSELAPLQCQRPLTEAAVIELITGGIHESRIADFISRCGARFVLDSGAELRLRKAGANNAIIDRLSAATASPERRPTAESPKDLVRQAEQDAAAGRWIEAYAKYKRAAAQRPNDKAIANALSQAASNAADLTAVGAAALCNQQVFDECEKQLQAAASYATTPRVQEIQGRLNAGKKQLQERWNQVQKMSSDGKLEDAVTELDALARFSYLFPNLAHEKESLRVKRVAAYIKKGNEEMEAQRWDLATEVFNSALRLDANNSQALRGLETLKTERDASTAFQQAQNAYQAKGYEVAYQAIQRAQRSFPDRPQYKSLAAQIGADWSKVLFEEARKLSVNRENFKDNQSALDKLQMAQRLDGRLAGLPDEMRNVKLALHSMYLQQAVDYEAVTDGTRAALTYASFVNAKETAPPGEFAFASKLRETGAIFNKKRGVQLLLNISNLSSGPGSLSDKFSRRVRNVIDRFGLPDIKVRTVDEYGKSPDENPQFLENRPNGKSPTAVLTVEIVSYDVSTDSKIEDKTSKYISGQEMVPNPAFEKAETEFRKITAALVGVKPGKKSKEGFSASDQVLAQQTLAATAREIARNKVSEYKYQEISQVMKAFVKINLEIRDQHEKQLIEGRPVEGKKEVQQTEIVNVRDRDINNLSNRAARMPPSQQLLREAEEAIFQKFDDDVAKMVRIYTDRFYLEGEKALRDSRVSDALENFLCHWFFYRGKVEENQARRIRDLVKKELGLDLGNVLAVTAGG